MVSLLRLTEYVCRHIRSEDGCRQLRSDCDGRHTALEAVSAVRGDEQFDAVGEQILAGDLERAGQPGREQRAERAGQADGGQRALGPGSSQERSAVCTMRVNVGMLAMLAEISARSDSGSTSSSRPLRGSSRTIAAAVLTTASAWTRGSSPAWSNAAARAAYVCAGDLCEQRRQQLVAAGVVLVEVAVGQAGPAADRAHGHGRAAALADQVERGVHQCHAPLLAPLGRGCCRPRSARPSVRPGGLVVAIGSRSPSLVIRSV